MEHSALTLSFNTIKQRLKMHLAIYEHFQSLITLFICYDLAVIKLSLPVLVIIIYCIQSHSTAFKATVYKAIVRPILE